ncbi:hypothetical protein IC582_016381 [Cucumis melo]|uniref:Uncharacterized protein n=1 Tax=Cucumis melo TaxID=3656 RepID=A0A9I9DIN6_CUCME
MLLLCSAAMAKPKAMTSKTKTVKSSSFDAIVEQLKSFAHLPFSLLRHFALPRACNGGRRKGNKCL